MAVDLQVEQGASHLIHVVSGAVGTVPEVSKEYPRAQVEQIVSLEQVIHPSGQGIQESLPRFGPSK